MIGKVYYMLEKFLSGAADIGLMLVSPIIAGGSILVGAFGAKDAAADGLSLAGDFFANGIGVITGPLGGQLNTTPNLKPSATVGYDFNRAAPTENTSTHHMLRDQPTAYSDIIKELNS